MRPRLPRCFILTSRRLNMTVWPSGLRRWLKAPFRKGVGSNPTAVTVSPGVTRGPAARVLGAACVAATALVIFHVDQDLIVCPTPL